MMIRRQSLTNKTMMQDTPKSASMVFPYSDSIKIQNNWWDQLFEGMNEPHHSSNLLLELPGFESREPLVAPGGLGWQVELEIDADLYDDHDHDGDGDGDGDGDVDIYNICTLYICIDDMYGNLLESEVSPSQIPGSRLLSSSVHSIQDFCSQLCQGRN